MTKSKTTISISAEWPVWHRHKQAYRQGTLLIIIKTKLSDEEKQGCKRVSETFHPLLTQTNSISPQRKDGHINDPESSTAKRS